jgi:hypothetical protein
MQQAKCKEAEYIVNKMVRMEQMRAESRSALNRLGERYTIPVIIAREKEQI